MRVAAVVVTYNRQELVTKCLRGILQQSHPLDAIILVDNACTDGTAEALRREGFFSDRLHYVRLEENVGSAGGFYAGLAHAYELGYDWFWLMDDDAVPTPQALEHLLRHAAAPRGEPLGGLISFQTSWTPEYLRYRLPNSVKEALVYELSCPIEVDHKTTAPIDHCSLVCFLIPRTVVSRVGLPRRELYFYADDFDYTLRIRKAGFRLYLAFDSLVEHYSNMNKVYDNRQNRMDNPLRWYYYYRNNIITMITHREFVGGRRIIAALLRLNCGAIKRIILACIRHDYALARVLLKAVVDGFALRLGKYVPPA